jgi:CheY-like chemotaxis protein
MTASVFAAAANALSVPEKKKRVLLVDTSRAQRDMRGETMRRLGMEVDCAADIPEARCWWRPDLYDLILFHVEEELPHLYKFWDDIRAATPAQRVAFLVGKPEYLAASPNGHATAPEAAAVMTVSSEVAPSSYKRNSLGGSKYWGILEACRRISAVRSLADARTRALRDRPLPPRDSAGTEPKRIMAESEIEVELHREEMQ